jgi:hypothetical protein
MSLLSGPQVISELRRQIQNQSGRHLYVVLGSYSQLEFFEKNDLAHAQMADGQAFPEPVNFNRELLACIEDDVLRRMVRDESRRPQAVESQLNQAFDHVLRQYFEQCSFLPLKQCELMFAYNLDVSKLRTYATNQNHLLLILPGMQVSHQIQLFHEAETRFQKQFPGQLVTENNLWELKA